MAKSKPVGLMDCPECGFKDAEVKTAKSGLLYRYCPDCNAQYFARTPEASERLQKKMRPVPVTDTGEAIKPEPVTDTDKPKPEPAPAPAPKPEKKPAHAPFGLNF